MNSPESEICFVRDELRVKNDLIKAMIKQCNPLKYSYERFFRNKISIRAA